MKFTCVGKHKQSPLEKVSKRKKKPKLDWIDGLKEYRDQYTALELQKKPWIGWISVLRRYWVAFACQF